MSYNPVSTRASLLLFMHIPKTAGTTLTEIIMKQYSRNLSYTDTFFYEDHVDELMNSDTLCGHFLYGVHKLIPRKCMYVTMLRDPVEQLISWFYFRYRSSDHTPYDGTFEDYLENSETARELNIQTRFLAGEFPDLLTAKQNMLTHVSFVGITEMFDESLFLLSKKLGWGLIRYDNERVNPNRPSRNQLSQDLIQKIQEKNHLDIQLYEIAKQRLEEQIRRLDSDSTREMHTFMDGRNL